MTTIDFIIISVIILGAIWGFARGFFNELASVVGLIAGFLAAKALYVWLAAKIAPAFTENSMSVAQVVAFIAIWIIVPIGFTLLASLFTRALEAVSLGWLNRLLGLLLGAVKWVLIISIFVNMIDYLDTYCMFMSQTTKNESMLYYPAMTLVNSLFPVARDVTNEYLFTL